jgi:hypothetical protein
MIRQGVKQIEGVGLRENKKSREKHGGLGDKVVE